MERSLQYVISLAKLSYLRFSRGRLGGEGRCINGALYPTYNFVDLSGSHPVQDLLSLSSIMHLILPVAAALFGTTLAQSISAAETVSILMTCHDNPAIFNPWHDLSLMAG